MYEGVREGGWTLGWGLTEHDDVFGSGNIFSWERHDGPSWWVGAVGGMVVTVTRTQQLMGWLRERVWFEIEVDDFSGAISTVAGEVLYRCEERGVCQVDDLRWRWIP